MVQGFFGLPSILLVASLVFSGKAEAALVMIPFLLAWIGATLAVGVAGLMNGHADVDLPNVCPIHASEVLLGLIPN